MAWAEDGYSRLVNWLKILLPLAALALLSTVFLLSETQEAQMELPYADVEAGGDGLAERVLKPSFSGATERGDLIAFVAESARPVGTGLGALSAENFQGRIDLVSGGDITFRSDEALLDQPEGTAELAGSVVVVSSTGYTVETAGLTAWLNDVRAESSGEIRGEGPPGRFVAGRMVVTGDADLSDVQMVFTDGVKLVYEPESD
ncbi:hypothetical protein OB2597_11876 [Pseudooceanicola batsensis HTCC2597]|uniref:Lipopolysaccharide export system protein LptC n=1 Tax=Pseudooceanicola batsensis (strain ATCC BAA-863 / DSM 15984 / KCTC 12145 / HTCC2597) TaxID=252305 RepID=A3TWE5_PSEBH|nr:hypothetical protein [Pseudooceanicola batsensis]EAQ03941.1 hypothetical protein OB2597_11876 [Pseudooceanicola batsensis HTCC2597]